MWRLLSERTAAENDTSVLIAILEGPLCMLAAHHIEEVQRLVLDLIERSSDKGAVDGCMALIGYFFLRRDVTESRQLVESMIGDIANHYSELRRLLLDASQLFTLGDASESNSTNDTVRQRAWTTACRIVEAARMALPELSAAIPDGARDGVEVECVRGVFDLIDTAAMFLHTAAEDRASACRRRSASADSGRRELALEQERFYRESQALVAELILVAEPSVAHHLVQALEVFVGLAPEHVFRRLVAVVEAAEPRGYQYESMAQDRIVNLIQLYFAEHRSIFRSNDECRAGLLRVLSIFVKAGWEQARRLSYQLEEIFR